MTQKYQVKVSMKQAAIVETGIVLKQGDFGMQIEIEVLDFDATGTTPQIVFRKAMGAVESTTITVSGNKYTYTFKGTELDTPGKCFCDLKLKNSTTQRISTASFMFRVVADTLDGLAEESSSYSDTIEQIAAELEANVQADIDAYKNISLTAKVPDPSYTSLDQFVEMGVYTLTYDKVYTNDPIGANTLRTLVTLVYSLNSPIGQILFERNTGNTYYRAYISGNWGAWDSKVNDEINNIKDALSDSIYKYYNPIKGLINGAGKLAYTNAAEFKYIPVASFDKIIIKGNGTNMTYYTLLKSAVIPQVGSSTDADFATGYTSRVGIALNGIVEVTAPSDAEYLYVTNYDANSSGNKSTAPQSIKINDAEINNSIIPLLEELSKREFDDVETVIKGSEKTVDYTSKLEDGYINYSTGAFGSFSGGTYRATKGFQEIPRFFSKLHINAKFAGTAGIAFYSIPAESGFVYGSNLTDLDVSQIPTSAKYMRLSDYSSDSTHINVKVIYYPGDVYTRLKNIEVYPLGDLLNQTPNVSDVTSELERGYINYQTGAFGPFGTDAYKAIKAYIPIPDYTYKIIIEAYLPTSTGAGMAFYSSENEDSFISGSQKMEFLYDEIPSNAKYFRFTDYNANGTHTNIKATVYYGDIVNRLSDVEQKTESVYMKKIACWGDSVTEGIGMVDQGTVTYNGETYESHLYTLLRDAGKPFEVENHGHRYERSLGVISRFKGAYLNESITIPADNSPVSLGDTYMENGQLIGTDKLSSYLAPDQPVRFFVGAGYDTNPLNIGGEDYTLTSNIVIDEEQHQVVQMRITKTHPDGVETIIDKNTLVLTSSNRTADINVVYVGINDGNGISLNDWLDRNLQVQESNPKTIVIGCTHHIWKGWQGMIGTDAEKYQTYLNAAHEKFGARFIDLYADLVSEKGMQIAIDAGYLTDRTAEQIAEDDANIANKIVPASITENGVAGNVHLNSAGYYIFAKLVYDRLVMLGWV